MKRPAYMWYPGDFRRDTAVQACPFEVKALWREMLDLMHDGEPYGHFTAGGIPIAEDALARIVGKSAAQVRRWIVELEERKVFSRTDAGVIYSRRMVRDERIRTVRAEAGKLGGNPALLKQKDKQPDNQGNNQIPTPAVALAVASSEVKDNGTVGQEPDAKPARSTENENLRDLARQLLAYLNDVTKRNYQPVPANLELIVARLKEGATVEQCGAVIQAKAEQWLGDENMVLYLRPATLFNRTKFAQYLGELPQKPLNGETLQPCPCGAQATMKVSGNPRCSDHARSLDPVLDRLRKENGPKVERRGERYIYPGLGRAWDINGKEMMVL